VIGVVSEDDNLLINEWFPITEVSIESVRERTPGTDYSPLSRIHVWFARRPLTTCRAAILGSLLPPQVDREFVLRLLGIPAGVDLRKAKEEIIKANEKGVRLKYNPFSWSKAYTYTPSEDELKLLLSKVKQSWCEDGPTIVDPMAGGGGIPFEALRLRLRIVAGDLNPVAFMCLKGILEYPSLFGKRLLQEVRDFCKEVYELAKSDLEDFFPKLPGEKIHAYLLARTVKCSSCGLSIPLSPNWWIVKAKSDLDSVAAKLVVQEKDDKCSFEIVVGPASHGLNPDKGTVKSGRAECPRCHVVMGGEEIKKEAQSGRMGHQFYCVAVKKRVAGKNKTKWSFRLLTDQEEEAGERVKAKLEEKSQIWKNRGLFPNELIQEGLKTREPLNFGITKWCDFFNSRQLLAHLTYLEKFLQVREKLFTGKQRYSEEWQFAEAITIYGAMVFDTCIDYDSILTRWSPQRSKVQDTMSIQAFPFKWSYAEWDHSQMLWPWASSKVLDSLEDIIGFLPESLPKPTVYCGTATKIPLKEKSVPCVIVDPPYAENVMYAEVSDFFYVWLRCILGDIFPEVFKPGLTEKDEEAVANPARFRGMGQSAKKLAQEDYKTKMEACFREMHRILQDDGVMTVMFTHRTAEAWSSLATALMNAGFTFVSSWPVHTEPSKKFGKMGKGVLKVTVLLTCRKRKANHPGIWEHIVEELRDVAKQKIDEFSKLGINEPDLKVSVYGPVLGKFADYYPVKTATGKEIDPQQALDQVTDVLNEKFLQEAGIQNADKETAAYINLLASFPTAETEYEEARLATVFGGLVTLDTLDIKGTYGFIEKDGKNIKILSARDRQAMGIIDPHDSRTLKTTIDHVHAAILQYERGGLIQVKRLMQDKNLDTAGSPFPIVLQAYARYADNSSNENFQKDAAIAKALLTALGKSIELAPKKGERLDHYTSE